MSGKVKVVDRGWDKLRKNYRKNFVVAVGIQGKEAEKDHGGVTNVVIGTVHEYGTATVPERSFLRSTGDKHEKKYVKEIAKATSASFEGKKIEVELLLVGEEYKADVISTIKAGIKPPLSAKTIAVRGKGATPLWHEGQLIGSISVVVRDKK